MSLMAFVGASSLTLYWRFDFPKPWLNPALPINNYGAMQNASGVWLQYETVSGRSIATARLDWTNDLIADKQHGH